MIPVYATAAALALSAALGFGLYKSVQRNGSLRAELHMAEQERDDAKAQADSLIAASRKHAQELAKARKQASSASATVARSADDGCLDRQLPSAIGALLRMRDEDSKDAAPAASVSGRPKTASEVHR